MPHAHTPRLEMFALALALIVSFLVGSAFGDDYYEEHICFGPGPCADAAREKEAVAAATVEFEMWQDNNQYELDPTDALDSYFEEDVAFKTYEPPGSITGCRPGSWGDTNDVDNNEAAYHAAKIEEWYQLLAAATRTEYVFADGTPVPDSMAEAEAMPASAATMTDHSIHLRRSTAKPNFGRLSRTELHSQMMEAAAAAAKAAGTPQYRWPKPKCIDWLTGEELRKHCQFQSIDLVNSDADNVAEQLLEGQVVCPELCAEAGFGFDGQFDEGDGADDDGLYHGNKVEL